MPTPALGTWDLTSSLATAGFADIFSQETDPDALSGYAVRAGAAPPQLAAVRTDGGELRRGGARAHGVAAQRVGVGLLREDVGEARGRQARGQVPGAQGRGRHGRERAVVDGVCLLYTSPS